MGSVVVRSAELGPPEDLMGCVSLLLTDPPYGIGKKFVGSNDDYSFDDPCGINNTLESLAKWSSALALNGTMVVCCDYRLHPWLVLHMENIGLCHRGDVVWEFGLGRPRTSWWPVKHNYFVTFTRGPDSGYFDHGSLPRVPRVAASPGYPVDKPIGSVWSYTFSNSDKERVGYPTQKPTKLLERFVLAHTKKGELVADPFCGSGSTLLAAAKHGRNWWGGDLSDIAVALSSDRLSAEVKK